MAFVEVTCEVCGKAFLRSRGEVNRSQRLGRRIYCSPKCVGLDNVDNLPPESVTSKNLMRGKTRDEYSPFREYLKIARRRVQERNKETTITLNDLKSQWEKQNGICPLTGWKLEIPPTTSWNEYPLTLKRASLDRIDSSRGYVPDNIRFVSVMANWAKNNFTDEDVIEFCHAVARNHPRA